MFFPPYSLGSRLLAVALTAMVGLLMMHTAGSAQELSMRERAIIRINIVDLLVNEPGLPLPVRQRREALRAYYEGENGELLWLGQHRAADFIARLRNAATDGLNPRAYPSEQFARLRAAVGTAGSRAKAIIELHFSSAFLEYSSDQKVGRFLPHKVDPNFFLQTRSIDQLVALTRVAVAVDLDRFFEDWQPRSPEYAELRSALAEYRALAAAGGWPSIPLGETLKPRMTDVRLPTIRGRLTLTDGASPQASIEDQHIYDDVLVELVKGFQARHGLDVDGIIGPATIVAMNVPVEKRILEINVAMERLRWMPEDLGRHHLIVNIAGFELRRVRDGAVEDRMPVVVGKPYHRTPVFSDRIQYLEFNPYWNVPMSIALREELPKLRNDPAGRAAAGFEAVSGDRVHNLASIDWNRYGPGNFPFRLRQRPGKNNALGRVKFMFPNQHSVYLHDTPSRSLFGRSARAFSHGCIRLSRPLDLAEQVLDVGGLRGWSRTKVGNVVASGKRTVVNLPDHLPVHITYLTAWVDEGTPHFRHDVYGHDEKLLAALEGNAIAW